MSTSEMEYAEEDFVKVCEHLERLKHLADLSIKFHSRGITRDELKQLLTLLGEAIRHSTGRTDLPLLNTLDWFKERIELLLPPERRFSVTELKEVLPPDPIFPIVHGVRQLVRGLVSLPPPPTLRELVDEFDALIDGFANELRRHTSVLIMFFKIVKPESIPWIIKFIKKNPHHVRTSLGEPLCIWWLERVLSETKTVWKTTRGPLKIDKFEVDAISVSASQKQFAVAEVKISKLQSELEEAFRQVTRAAKFFMEPSKMKLVGFKWVKGLCKPSEVAVVTLYNLGDDKGRLKSELAHLLENEGLSGETASLYDIRDVLDTLRGWRFEAKERYQKLFETLNRILETT